MCTISVLIQLAYNVSSPSQDGGVCEAGAEGLAAMASFNSSRQAIGQLGGVEALVGVMGREDGRVRGAAVHALAQVITEAPANSKSVKQLVM